MSLFDLSGRVAIVTGGNGGIGLGMAEGLAAAGATVVLAGRNAKKARARREGPSAGGKAEFAEADVTSEDSCRALIDEAAARHGRLDILVNNAGTNIRKPPRGSRSTEWHIVMDTNLTSAFVCSHAAYPHMNRPAAARSSISAR